MNSCLKLTNNSFSIKSLAIVVGIFFLLLLPVSADQVDEIRDEIENRQDQIENIEKDIEEYEQRLGAVQEEKRSLSETVNSLEATQSNLIESIETIEARIQRAETEIEHLNNEIKETTQKMKEQKEGLKIALKTLNELDQNTLVEHVLSNESLAEVWETIDTLSAFQEHIKVSLADVKELKEDLSAKKKAQLETQDELSALMETYEIEQRSVQAAKKQQEILLAETGNKEENYQRVLEQKRQQKEEFEQQLHNFESQLKSVVNDSDIPTPTQDTYHWPVGNVTITQNFGGTEFAKRNPQAYGRPFHNGTDFGAAVGTPIYSIRQGTVAATGNTDRISGCYSYGKWILVEHDNGLSSLYGHLSLIDVQPGEKVSGGSVIGYSGNTGYSTGPHLHLTMYASGAVQVVPLGSVKSRTNCAQARIPVAPHEGYLNPMKYLSN